MSRDDELLELPDIPEAQRQTLGAIAGYRHGRWLRRGVYLGATSAVVLALGMARAYVQRLEAEARRPAPQYWLSDEGTGRTNELVWSSGSARLGLSGAEPGVSRIRLPDRLLQLAEGHEHAQVRVEVRDGATQFVEVLAGKVTEMRLPATP